jgi:hypothetical protein
MKCHYASSSLGAAPGIEGKGALEATAAWSLTNRLDVVCAAGVTGRAASVADAAGRG